MADEIASESPIDAFVEDEPSLGRSCEPALLCVFKK